MKKKKLFGKMPFNPLKDKTAEDFMIKEKCWHAIFSQYDRANRRTVKAGLLA